MDVGTLLSVAQTLFAALQCSQLKELYSKFGYKKELEKLQGTVGTIRAVLQDAESKQVEFELSEQAKLWIEELKDALYDADDLVDEFVTLAKQKKLIQGDDLSKKVKGLFSRFNSPLFARKMSKGIKEIREKLEDISSTHNKFGFKLDCQRIRKRREETCSYVDEQEIIGRDDDLEKIVCKLLDPAISCLSIVGIGGLGKTTLAQLVYNHPSIKEAFPDYRWWTCISDDGGSNLKEVLSKILESVTNRKYQSNPSMDRLQKELRNEIVGKEYLLVLDDLWSEDRDKWLELMAFFKGSLGGSSILVTTRSRKTATIVGGEIYDLQGLSDEDSWSLFEKTAFDKDHEVTSCPELDQIGREIIKKCSNVPLAIRVVGTALYAQDKAVWLSFQDVALVRIKGQDGIEPILKLSYLNLDPQLKICFSYCALYPKDYVIEKEQLIQLWIAQGYVVPLHDSQCIEDVAEEYLLTLLRRCFFQDVTRYKFSDEIKSFKMHDLMHDIAQEVAGYNSMSSNLMNDNKIRHLMHLGWNSGTEGLLKGTKIRTYLGVSIISNPKSPEALGSLLDNWISLRALDLGHSRMRSLPSTIGKLLHLRYLDLSHNSELEELPNSMTKLHNLQFLSVAKCGRLKQLPKDFRKLTHLRVLETSGCYSLSHVPRGMGKLSCLWKLPFIVLGEGTSDKEGWQLACQVQEINALQNLKGRLEIQINIPADAKYVMENGSKRECLSQHLIDICIRFPDKRDCSEMGTRIYEAEEALLEDLLQPHHNSNLKELGLKWFCGGRMPNWAREDDLTIFVPNLVKVKLKQCRKLQQIAMLGTLHKLKILELEELNDLEYIEKKRRGNGALESHPSFFPSLETLKLRNLPKLKGWWREESSNNQIDGGLKLPSFPCLSCLVVENCPNLASMPLCPTVEDLTLREWNVNLRIMERVESGNSRLRSLDIDEVGHFKSAMHIEAFQCLSRLCIFGHHKMEKLSEVEEMFRTCSSSLRELHICGWRSELKTVSRWLEHLTGLEKLLLGYLNLSKEGEGEEDSNDDGMPWHSFQHSLRSLKLVMLPEMVKLPIGMRHLTALQSLIIHECRGLKSMPEWMPELTSLKQLRIEFCSDALYERCCEDTGEDWPSIQHIPDSLIYPVERLYR